MNNLGVRVGVCLLGGSIFAGTAYATAITYAPAPSYKVSDSDRQQKWEDIAGSYFNDTKYQEFYLGIRGIRRKLAKDSRGDVLEVGAGTGTMIGQYPAASILSEQLQQQQQQTSSSSETSTTENNDNKNKEELSQEGKLVSKKQTTSPKIITNAHHQLNGVTSVVVADRAQNMLSELDKKIEARLGYKAHILSDEEAETWKGSFSSEKTENNNNNNNLVVRKIADEIHPNYQIANFSAEDIPFPDDSFDTVVDCFGLCSYDDPVKALMEMSRVCKPAGRIELLEHGKGTWTRVNMQLDKWAPRHARSWGCWWNRDMRRYLRLAGLKVVSREDKHFGTTNRITVKPNKQWMVENNHKKV